MWIDCILNLYYASVDDVAYIALLSFLALVENHGFKALNPDFLYLGFLG